MAVLTFTHTNIKTRQGRAWPIETRISDIERQKREEPKNKEREHWCTIRIVQINWWSKAEPWKSFCGKPNYKIVNSDLASNDNAMFLSSLALLWQIQMLWLQQKQMAASQQISTIEIDSTLSGTWREVDFQAASQILCSHMGISRLNLIDLLDFIHALYTVHMMSNASETNLRYFT